jgi:hypothetical protein
VGVRLSLISAIEIFDSRCWPVAPADGMSTSRPFTALEQFELAVQAPDRAPTNPDGAPTRLLCLDGGRPEPGQVIGESPDAGFRGSSCLVAADRASTFDRHGLRRAKSPLRACQPVTKRRKRRNVSIGRR